MRPKPLKPLSAAKASQLLRDRPQILSGTCQGVHGFYPPPPAIVTIALSSQVPDLGRCWLKEERRRALYIATSRVNAEGLCSMSLGPGVRPRGSQQILARVNSFSRPTGSSVPTHKTSTSTVTWSQTDRPSSCPLFGPRYPLLAN